MTIHACIDTCFSYDHSVVMLRLVLRDLGGGRQQPAFVDAWVFNLHVPCCSNATLNFTTALSLYNSMHINKQLQAVDCSLSVFINVITRVLYLHQM